MIHKGHSAPLEFKEDQWVRDLKKKIGGNTMKKTPQQKEIMKDYVRCPFVWDVVDENGHFLHIRNWFTGEHRICRK